MCVLRLQLFKLINCTNWWSIVLLPVLVFCLCLGQSLFSGVGEYYCIMKSDKYPQVTEDLSQCRSRVLLHRF